MMDNEFKAAFSCFLERHEYDDAESALFEIVRTLVLNPNHGLSLASVQMKVLPFLLTASGLTSRE